MQRIEAGQQLLDTLRKFGFVEEPAGMPDRQRARLTSSAAHWVDIWGAFAEWAQAPVDLGPDADGEDDLLLFQGVLDLKESWLHEPDRPAFVLLFRRQLQFPNAEMGYVQAESVVLLELAFRVHDDFRLVAPTGGERSGVVDAIWYGGGHDASQWAPTVEATESFQIARAHQLWAATVQVTDEPDPG
ncbi:hypothetical protein C8N24_3993 [Solirubrobacter pauli]|uniref:Uncharacterized protein n=1 Tax=Solirubrobacter pauli TaxID=166793 RepID=A0A660KY23_9ACTN|nr:hypothetical protein [Solirubrobacter pauli]RKQ85985.1 hypothetical protein C8N24_3993 [Solirubrobacter pauli]